MSAMVTLYAVLTLVLFQGTALDRFKSADGFGRTRVVNEIVQGKLSVSTEEATRVFSAAMQDPDSRVRRSSVEALAAALSISRNPAIPRPPDSEARLALLVEIASSLRPLIDRAMEDAEAGVRLEALRAFAALDTPTMKPGVRIELPPPVVRRLVDRHARDQSGLVRGFIVQILRGGLRSPDPTVAAAARRVTFAALAGDDPFEIQAAARNAGELRDPAALPVLVKHLSHESHVARLAAASALGAFGAHARPHLPALEAALAREASPGHQDAIKAAIHRIRTGG